MKFKILLLIVILVVFMLLDIVFDLTHGDGWWAKIPGIFAVIGIIGCAGIIIVAKILGPKWLRRGEDYYDSNRDD